MNIKPNLYNVSQEGASHRDELGYLFHRLNKNDELTNEVQAMIDSITTSWTNFAKSGYVNMYLLDNLELQYVPTSYLLFFLCTLL